MKTIYDSLTSLCTPSNRSFRTALLLPALLFTLVLTAGCLKSTNPDELAIMTDDQEQIIDNYICGNLYYLAGSIDKAKKHWDLIDEVLTNRAALFSKRAKDEIAETNSLLESLNMAKTTETDTKVYYSLLLKTESKAEKAYFYHRKNDEAKEQLIAVRKIISEIEKLGLEEGEVKACLDSMIRVRYYKAGLTDCDLDVMLRNATLELQTIRNKAQINSKPFFSGYLIAAERFMSYIYHYSEMVQEASSLLEKGETESDQVQVLLQESIEYFARADSFFAKTTNNANSEFCRQQIEKAKNLIKEDSELGEERRALRARLKTLYDGAFKNFMICNFSAAEKKLKKVLKELTNAPKNLKISTHKDTVELLKKCKTNESRLKQAKRDVRNWRLDEAERNFRAIRDSDDRLAKSDRMKNYVNLPGTLRSKYDKAVKYYRRGDIDRAYANLSHVVQHSPDFTDAVNLYKMVEGLYKHLEMLRDDYMNCRFSNLVKHFNQGKEKFPGFQWPRKIFESVQKGERLAPLWKEVSINIDSGFFQYAIPLLEKCLRIDPSHEMILYTLENTKKKM